MKSGENGQVVSGKKTTHDNARLYMFITQGPGQNTRGMHKCDCT